MNTWAYRNSINKQDVKESKLHQVFNPGAETLLSPRQLEKTKRVNNGANKQEENGMS